MNLQLPNDISTQQDLQTLTLEVKTYASWYSKNAIKRRLKVKRANKAQPEISPEAKELIHDWSLQAPLSTNSLDQLLMALESFKDTAPQLTITLAAPASGSIKKTLVGWCRKNIASNALVNFQFNSEILGGMVVRYESKIYDWSFRRQILAASQTFPEVLRRV